MDIANKDRFPHIYAMDKLGGERTAEGEKYYEEHTKELEEEFVEIMRNVLEREKFGDNKMIHGRIDTTVHNG